MLTTVLPAVCPVCARVRELDIQALPASLVCEGCGAELTPTVHGRAVILIRAQTGPAEERPEVEALLARAERERKPDRAHALILQALEADPESFAAHRALLYHGRLHEVARRPGDFSLIKCHLLNMYEQPERYAPERRDALVDELLRDPLLARTGELSGDADAFLREYLEHMTAEYLRVFVRGRNDVGRGVFGFSRSSESVRGRCAAIVENMERNIRADPRLDEAQRELLSAGLQRGLGAGE